MDAGGRGDDCRDLYMSTEETACMSALRVTHKTDPEEGRCDWAEDHKCILAHNSDKICQEKWVRSPESA